MLSLHNEAQNQLTVLSGSFIVVHFQLLPRHPNIFMRFGMAGPPKTIPIKHQTSGGMTGCLGTCRPAKLPIFFSLAAQVTEGQAGQAGQVKKKVSLSCGAKG